LDDELDAAHTDAAVRRRRGPVAPGGGDAPAVIGAVWAAWVLLWLIEQRW
jgi:hypothetical protein